MGPHGKLMTPGPSAADDAYEIGDVSEELFLKINNWHADHPGEPLTLSGTEIAELAGCACHEKG